VLAWFWAVSFALAPRVGDIADREGGRPLLITQEAAFMAEVFIRGLTDRLAPAARS
jgi:hypothetical protein